MSIVAVIPARSGSKGVPHKNIRPLAGKPLLAYSIQAAKKSSLINRVILSTDSMKYANLAKEYGAEAPFLRPTELSGDKSTDYDWVKHLLNWLVENEGNAPEYLVHLRPTNPLRDPEIIDSAIEKFMNNSEATALRSAHEMPETAYKMCEIDGGYIKSICDGSFDHDNANKPRQLFPTTFTPNGYVDVMRTSYINENKLLHGNRVMAFITSIAYDVDTLDDFELLEYMVEKDNTIFQSLFVKN